MSGLTIEEIANQLGPGTHWQIEDGKLKKVIKFKDFKEAFAFVSKVADLAENNNHHPGILINYNSVTLTLWSHDSGGITERDLKMAKEFDQINK